MSEDIFPELVPTLRKRTVRWFSILAGIALLAALTIGMVGAVYQLMSVRRDRDAYPPPGRLVDVGGYRLHAQVSGEGTPTVILEAGLASNSVDWSLVAGALAQETRVFRYDRAGLGWSDAATTPTTPDTMIRDVDAVLDALGIEGPYVFVGHSMGGHLARLFQARHPEQVHGMVLVDAAHEHLSEALPLESQRRRNRMKHTARVLGVASHLGVARVGLRIFGERLDLPISSLDARNQDLQKSFYATPKFMIAAAKELDILDEMGRQVGATRGDVWAFPLAVVTPGQRETVPDWSEHQRDLATLSSDSAYLVAEGSGHYVQLDQPDLVVEAVTKIVKKIREANAFSNANRPAPQVNSSNRPRPIRVKRIWGVAPGHDATGE
jgi:pimeloyl-ACP methyl ester carboxylesterase